MKILGEKTSSGLVNLQPINQINQGKIIPLVPEEKPDAPC